MTLILVPKSENTKPQATALTEEKVKNYLNKRRLLTTSIKIDPANYIEVNLNLEIFSLKQDPDTLQEKVKQVLDNYLHPITGGKESKGWSFGENLYLSDLYTLLSTIEGVNNIETLKIINAETTFLEVPQDTLISSGQYFIDIRGLDPVICRM